jgi:hypothetical protein
VRKVRTDRNLKLWIDQILAGIPSSGDNRYFLTLRILKQAEAAGDAMRQRKYNGEMSWIASPQLRQRFAEERREAMSDLEYI